MPVETTSFVFILTTQLQSNMSFRLELTEMS